LKYWRYGKTREFRVKIREFFGAKFNFTRNSCVLPYRQYFKWPADVANIDTSEWKMFHGELSAAVNKYWCVFSGRIIYTEKE
jgi:hypothetical protein